MIKFGCRACGSVDLDVSDVLESALIVATEADAYIAMTDGGDALLRLVQNVGVTRSSLTYGNALSAKPPYLLSVPFVTQLYRFRSITPIIPSYVDTMLIRRKEMTESDGAHKRFDAADYLGTRKRAQIIWLQRLRRAMPARSGERSTPSPILLA